METAGVEPAPPRCKRGALPSKLRPRVDRMWGDREDGPSDATRRPSHVPRLPASDLEVGRAQADVVPEALDGLTGLEIPGGLERLPPVEIRGKRLDRATGAVQGHHEMDPELLAQRE